MTLCHHFDVSHGEIELTLYDNETEAYFTAGYLLPEPSQITMNLADIEYLIQALREVAAKMYEEPVQ